MKTLGQQAYEHWCDAARLIAKNWDTPNWPEDSLCEKDRASWEAAAQAVRAAVIEECAKICDELAKSNDGWTEQEAEDQHIAAILRSLK